MFDCGIEFGSLLKIPIPMSSNSLKDTTLGNKRKRNTSHPIDLSLKEEIRLHTPKFESIDISSIDIILISNYMNMLALPYIVSPESDFQGKIYATEPTIQLGRKFMEELITGNQVLSQHCEEVCQEKFKKKSRFDSQSSSLQSRDALKLREDVEEMERKKQQKQIFQYSNVLKPLYSMEAVDYCMSQMIPVSYQQGINLFGVLEAVAVSSGYCLGSANWILKTKYEKIVYISSSSSASTRHPEPLCLEELKDAQVAIINDINCDTTIYSTLTPSNKTITPITDPFVSHQISAEVMLNELCKNIGTTIGYGGDVLIPCYSSGLIYDLIDFVRTYLSSVNLGSVNMFFVSPIAEHSLAYSNISSEWLCDIKQQKAFIAESPFQHIAFLKSKQLQVFNNVQQFSTVHHQTRSQPCIVFAGHPSLRFGDILHLMKLFNQSEKNSMIVIEPHYDFPALIEPFLKEDKEFPFQKLNMNIVHCPIDLRLNNSEVTHLMKQIKPDHLLIPEHVYKVLMKQQQHRQTKPIHVKIEDEEEDEDELKPSRLHSSQIHQLSFIAHVDTFEYLTIHHIPIKRKFEQAQISDDLAKNLYPKEMKGSYVSRVNAFMFAKDGTFLLTSQDNTSIHERSETGTENRAMDIDEGEDTSSHTGSIAIKGKKQLADSNNTRNNTSQLLFGEVDIQTILKHLQKHGYHVKVRETKFGIFNIDFVEMDITIQHCAQETVIEIRNENPKIDSYKMDKVRKELKQILMEVHHCI